MPHIKGETLTAEAPMVEAAAVDEDDNDAMRDQYQWVATRATNAMRILMLQPANAELRYNDEISRLAAVSSDLINNYDQSVENVVAIIENSMRLSHEQAKTDLDAALGMARFEKNATNPHSIRYKPLASRVKALEVYKNDSIESLIEAIVSDTKVRAVMDHRANIGDFNPM